MPEKFPTPSSAPAPKPEEEIAPAPKQEFLTQEEMSEYDSWLEDFPVPEVTQESPEACAEKIAKLETLFADFENTHDLEALRAITHFDSRAERESSIRQSALNSLPPIIALLNHLREQTAVSKETYNALKARSWELENAVGFIQGDPSGKFFDVVIHDREHNY